MIAGYGGYVFGDDGTDPSDIGLNNAGAVEGISYATDWFQNVWPKGMQDIKVQETSPASNSCPTKLQQLLTAHGKRKHTKKTISIMVLQNSYSKQWTALSTIWRRKRMGSQQLC